MKTDFGWSSFNGTNSSGFSGLPGGQKHLRLFQRWYLWCLVELPAIWCRCMGPFHDVRRRFCISWLHQSARRLFCPMYPRSRMTTQSPVFEKCRHYGDTGKRRAPLSQ